MSKDGYVFADNTPFQILKRVAVLPSAEKDPIDLKEVILSGDGTAIPEYASARGNSIQGDENNRRYSDLDVDISWGRDLGSYFFGYHGYFSCIHNPESSVDLPVLM